MIKIKIPNNNIKERKYIISLFLDEFLGLEYNIIVDEKINDYIIYLQNDKMIRLKDSFFSKYPKDLEYLNIQNLPTEVTNIYNDKFDLNFMVLYGSDNIFVLENSIEIEVDIFASSFFMLTRWEEYVVKKRDNHNRFLAKYSIAYKYNFLHRPIVNEYIELLYKALSILDNSLIKKKRNFKIYLTHDVDLPFRYDKFFDIFKYTIKDFLYTKNILSIFKTLKEAISVKFNLQQDPLDTFDMLMDISEKNNLKSYFFFMGTGKTKYDNRYNLKDKKILNIVSKIKERNHNIGIHPTYNAYNDTKQFKKEIEEVKQYTKSDIKIGREHYLRFEVPTTWQIWEDNNMKWDSTMCYADMVGFRCGICYEYSVFNILTRNKLNLKEKPLIIMETTLVEYEQLNYNQILDKIAKLKKSVKEYDGEFVFLWHNHSFNNYQWNKIQNIYKIVGEIKCLNLH
jgi:hypothetical protein